MTKRAKRRRDARRKARLRQEERTEGGPDVEAAGSGAAAPGEERELAAGAVAPGGSIAHSRAARKKARRREGAWDRLQRVRVSPWLIATPIVGAVVVVVAFLILSSGSSGSTGGGPSERTPDPRVAGLTPTVSFDIEASDRGQGSSDSFFSPAEIRAKAGDVIELVVTNTGTVSHNLRVSGPNGKYDVDTTGSKGDDFEMPPNTVLPGKTERLVVKIDEPGTYPFRCDFHPQFQKGTLVLEEP